MLRALLPQPVDLDRCRVVGHVGRQRSLKPARLVVMLHLHRRRQNGRLRGARHRVGKCLGFVVDRLAKQLALNVRVGHRRLGVGDRLAGNPRGTIVERRSRVGRDRVNAGTAAHAVARPIRTKDRRRRAVSSPIARHLRCAALLGCAWSHCSRL
ncbi:hypothetical protein Ctob_009235, partial [Chrysochromulina tobinii]